MDETRRGFLTANFLAALGGAFAAKDTLVQVEPKDEQVNAEALNVLVRELDYTFPEGGFRCFECDWVMIVPKGFTSRDKVIECWNKDCKSVSKRYKVLPYVPMVEL